MLKGANDSKKTIIVTETDCYDAPPLDFSFKSLKELKEILKEEPRNKGKRKPIVNEDDKKDDKKKDGKNAEEKKTEQVLSSVDQQAENEGEITEKPEGERNEEEQQEKPKEKEEPAKQKTQEIHIIPESHINTVVTTHNVSLQGVLPKGAGGKNLDDGKVNQTKQVKINLICAAIVLSYNEIRDLLDFRKVIDSVMYHSDKLSWIDVSHNHLTQISEEFKTFTHLRSLNIHCNYINDLTEVQKLAPCKELKNLTIHGNAIDTIPSFRLYIIGILPTIQKLDTVLVTKKERDNAMVWRNSFGHSKFPKVKVPTFPPEKEKPKQAEQND